MSLKTFVAGSSLFVLSACHSPKAKEAQLRDSTYLTTPLKQKNMVLDTMPDSVIYASHPLEQIARNIDPDIRICVIPQGDWADTITHGKGFSSDYTSELAQLLPEEALKRIRHYFPESEKDTKLDSMFCHIAKDFKYDLSTSRTAFDSKGNRYVVVVLGSALKNTKDFFDFAFQDNENRSKRAQQVNPTIADYALSIDYHELAHGLDKNADHISEANWMYERHKAEILGCAFGELKVLQQTGDLSRTRLVCDTRMLSGFYDAAGSNMGNICYFSHTLFDNIKSAYQESQDGLKTMSDAELFQLAENITKKSIYTPEKLKEIDEKFQSVLTKMCGKMTPYGPAIDESLVGDYIVSAAVKRGLLKETTPYVKKLVEAEQRVFGLSKNQGKAH